jgi:hypothetical protein
MKATDPQVMKLKEIGIPINTAIFVYAVDTIHNISEKRLDIHSQVHSRTADMYYTPMGLLCLQLEEAFLVPLANIISAK